MKYYTLYADNRRPLKFSGELLGQSDSKSESTIISSINRFVARYGSSEQSLEAAAHLRLSLYRSTSGKIVLHTERLGAYQEPEEDFKLETLTSNVDIHETLEAYIESARKKSGAFGSVTVSLLNDVIKNHPKLEELWVETID